MKTSILFFSLFSFFVCSAADRAQIVPHVKAYLPSCSPILTAVVSKQAVADQIKCIQNQQSRQTMYEILTPLLSKDHIGQVDFDIYFNNSSIQVSLEQGSNHMYLSSDDPFDIAMLNSRLAHLKESGGTFITILKCLIRHSNDMCIAYGNQKTLNIFLESNKKIFCANMDLYQ